MECVFLTVIVLATKRKTAPHLLYSHASILLGATRLGPDRAHLRSIMAGAKLGYSNIALSSFGFSLINTHTHLFFLICDVLYQVMVQAQLSEGGMIKDLDNVKQRKGI